MEETRNERLIIVIPWRFKLTVVLRVSNALSALLE
jgi:hypothetical protein